MADAKRYDAVVVGAGPGGYVCAIRLGQLGKKTLVIDAAKLGGVCLNWGCIPSKALIAAAELYWHAQHAESMGIKIEGKIALDHAKLQAWKRDIVDRLGKGIAQLLTKNGVEVLMGRARFVASDRLEVDTKEGKVPVAFGAAVIATGSRSIEIPGFAFDRRGVLSSEEALDLEGTRRIVVVGGGVIGLEIGTYLQKLGSELTVVELTPTLLPGTDPELVRVVERRLKKRGARVFLETKAVACERSKDELHVRIAPKDGKEETIVCDKVLVSVGRKPNSEDLGLDKAGVQTDKRGYVTSDGRLRTNVPNIYAIGDVSGVPFLAHKASKEGIIAAEVIAGHRAEKDHRAMPAATFTDPEIATVGLTEAEARAKGLDIKVGRFPFAASGRALVAQDTDGLVKVVADAKTDELLGVHIVGVDASNLIGEAALAIEMGACAEDLALTVHAHPTLPECIMEAAENLHGRAIHALNRP